MPRGKRRSAEFRVKVALEAAKGSKTLAQLSSEFGLHASQISEWKGRLPCPHVCCYRSIQWIDTERQRHPGADASWGLLSLHLPPSPCSRAT